jgi:hypothetical protein
MNRGRRPRRRGGTAPQRRSTRYADRGSRAVAGSSWIPSCSRLSCHTRADRSTGVSAAHSARSSRAIASFTSSPR